MNFDLLLTVYNNLIVMENLTEEDVICRMRMANMIGEVVKHNAQIMKIRAEMIDAGHYRVDSQGNIVFGSDDEI